jgi:prepilin signal peptidase PulO-like enzyme (type II secretory pathway)
LAYFESSDPTGLNAEVAEFVFFIPLLLGMVVTIIYGVIQAIRFRHRVLAILSTVLVVCLAAWVGLVASGGNRDALAILGIIYMATSISVPVWWFAFARKRYHFRDPKVVT